MPQSYFLLQVNNSSGYPNIMDNGQYQNGAWASKRRDRAQGDVESGDILLVYCTADVPNYGMSLAFQVPVEGISEDRTTFDLGAPMWFTNPLKRDVLLQSVDQGTIDEVFRSCGAQGFNICQLSPLAAQTLLELSGDGEVQAKSPTPPIPQQVGSPLDRLIETKLEQWLVEHWDDIDFGQKLVIYTESGEAVGQQYDTGIVGRIDLLCEAEESNNLVVIELKRGRPSDEVVGQLARYIGWVKQNLANGREVNGIILAPEFDDRLRYAASAIPGTLLLRYQTRFEVHPD